MTMCVVAQMCVMCSKCNAFNIFICVHVLNYDLLMPFDSRRNFYIFCAFLSQFAIAFSSVFFSLHFGRCFGRRGRIGMNWHEHEDMNEWLNALNAVTIQKYQTATEQTNARKYEIKKNKKSRIDSHAHSETTFRVAFVIIIIIIIIIIFDVFFPSHFPFKCASARAHTQCVCHLFS